MQGASGYDVTYVAPPSPPPPPPPPRDEGSYSPRYVYLLNRLRNREITMEEATELFALQQRMILRARTAVPPAPTSSETGTPAEAPMAARPSSSVGSDGLEERIWQGLLVLGPIAGVLAAMLKKFAESNGRPSPASSSTPKRTPTR